MQQIIAAHAGLARKTGCDDDDIGVGGGPVIIGSGDVHVVAFHGTGFEQIKCFALRNAFHDVDQNDIG